MLLDAPTSALDPEMFKEVLDGMVELAEAGMTMICVAHEMVLACGVADSMVFIDQGAIVESAPSPELSPRPGRSAPKQFLRQILTQ